MQNTTANYKLEINKPSREFECKITIGNNIYNNDELVNLTLEHTQPQEGFSIGDTISQSLDLTLLNRGDIIYSTSQIKVEIGLKIGSTIEYILMGIFNIDDIEKTDYTTKFTAYDNMIKFETPYFSSLGDKPTLKQVVNELSKITGIEFIGSLPNYTVSKLEGFTCREVLSYVASICGGNAVITRDGKFTIKTLSEIKKSIDGNNYFDYKREEVKYKIGKISCQIDENNILSKGSAGTDSMELGFENPWVTESILNDIYNKLKSVEYLGYSMKWQGDLSLDPYDIITVTDIKNVIRKIPILSQKISYTGGLTSEIGAKGETKNKNSFSNSGSIVNKVNRAIIEQAIIKEALIEKANIKEVEAVSIRTQILEAKTAKIEEAIIDVAHISDLNAINANIQNLIATDAKFNNALINKADITELNAVVGNINIINSELANIKTLVNGNLSSENIQAGGITSDKLTIANGFITNAMIANLDVSKINAGNISTNKFRIVSDNGGIEIVGATQQFKDKNNKVRIQMGQDAKGNFNFILRGEDGTTTLIDHTGIKEKAIADNLIKGNMVATDAIGEKQINYSSLIIGLNKDTNTQLIKASKVAIDFVGQSLEVAFNSLKNQADNAKLLIENHSTTIGVMQGQINTAINNTQIVKDGKTILLKDDYNRTVSKVDSINSTIGTHTTKINELTGNITSVDTKVNSVQRDLEGTKSTVSNHTNLIDGLNSKVSTQGSSIEQLKNQITLKVNSTELTTMKNELIGKIDSIEIGGRNTLLNATGNLGNTNHWSNVVLDTNKKVEGCNSFKITRNNFANGNARYQGSQTIDLSRLSLKANDYITLSGWVYVDSSINLTGSSNEFAFRNYYNSSSSFEDLCVFKYTNVQKNTWTKFSVTSKVTKDSYKAGALLLSISANGLIYVSKLKLEKGSKATDFTLAPEDIDLAIDKKANTVDVYKKSETYTKSETDSKINVAKDEITLGVSNTYETKSNVTTKVNDAISGIKIGGRNYAINTKIESVQAGNNTINQTNTLYSFYLNELLGREITVSFDWEVTGTTTSGLFYVQLNATPWTAFSDTISVSSSNKKGKTSKTFIMPTSSATSTLMCRKDNFVGTLIISNFKIEIGNRVTDWTSAPEDIDSVIGTKANKSDVYVKSEVYTKAQTDSAINVAKDSINLGVSQTYETKTNVTSKVNTAKTEAVNSAVATSKSYADTKKAEAISTASTDATNKVNSAKTELNTAINKKANSTDVYTKTEVYTKAQTDSAIKVAKDEINLGVKNTYETKTNVENKISTAVNNVQIGGRNLAIGTSDSWKSASGFSGETNYCVFRHVINTKTLSVGDRLTVSFMFKCENLTNNNTARVIRIQGSGDVTGWNSGAFNSYNIPLDYSKPTQEIKINYTITITADHLKNSKWNINFRTDYITGGTIYLKELLAEKGTKASSWIPAPEDVDSAIDKKANIVDVYKKSETYTKSETDSKINIAKDQINLSVSGTYETKTNVESKINTAKANAINSAKSYTDGQITTVNKTITNKVSEIKATTDSISQKVSTTESKITTINNNISGLTNRVSTAESKLTATSLTTTISSAISGGTSSISTTQFVMDKNGLTIKNGGLTIQNKAGTTVLNSDTNGNLIFTGTAKSQSGARWVGLDSGGITFQDSQKNEQMLRIAISYFNENRDINGVNLSLAKYGDYIRISHIDKADLTTGWSSSNTQYNFMDFWSSDQIVDGVAYKKGINVYAPMYIHKRLKLYSGTNFLSEIDGAISWNNGTGTVNNLLGMYGDNGAVLGYKSGDSFNARFLVSEVSHPGTGDNLISWGNYNGNGYTLHNFNIVAKSLSVQGSKNCLQETKSYGARLINAYETAEYFFGDLGFGKINEEGVCYVDIDDVFLECVNTDAQYHVFTQIYNGKITSIERYKTYFIVKGEQNTEFSWELKAKRKGYEINRLDLPDIETQGDEIDIFSFENEIETDEEDLMKELTFELENLLLKEHEEDE